ncbi:MAG: deoxyribose-phosphate aldolase [Bacillota bacterium]|nr:deoxyribose-phosphate aldolase [Bacillota bacterium]
MKMAKYFDHTILKPDVKKEDVIKICEEAKEFDFYSVCINPYYVGLVKEQLEETDVKVTSVIGFPLGASISEVKAFEAQKAIEDGADEIDMVINISALKNKDYSYVENDIKAVKEVCKDKALLKVIIEACLLTDDEKIKACELSQNAKADYVKTSTGFSTGGATVHDVKLMRETVGPSMGVKASGAVRDLEKAKQVIEAGATRIGASASVGIVKGEVSTSDY